MIKPQKLNKGDNMKVYNQDKNYKKRSCKNVKNDIRLTRFNEPKIIKNLNWSRSDSWFYFKNDRGFNN